VNTRRGQKKSAAPDGPVTAPRGLDAVREGNSFGLGEALFGILAGFLLATLAVSLYAAATPHGQRASQFGEEIVSLVGLWIGLLGAVVVATRLAGREDAPQGPAGEGAAAAGRAGRRGTGSVVRDYGFQLRPWPDIPLGILVGVASQYVLVPVAEAPLLPFVHHLSTRLGHPALSLTNHVYGPGLVVLALLVCVGSPVVEELFFRGLLLRALLGKLHGSGRRCRLSSRRSCSPSSTSRRCSSSAWPLSEWCWDCWRSARDASAPPSSPTWPSTRSPSSP
jgi:membrane protease YdiL (CAAX protease family)